MGRNLRESYSRFLILRESPAMNQSWSSFFSFSLSEGLLGRVMAPDRAQMSAEHPSTHLHPVSGAYPTYMPPGHWKCADIGNIFMHLTSIKWSNLLTGFLQKKTTFWSIHFLIFTAEYTCVTQLHFALCFTPYLQVFPSVSAKTLYKRRTTH